MSTTAAVESLSAEQRELRDRVCRLREHSRGRDRFVIDAAIHPQYVGWEQFIVEALRDARALTVSLVAEQDGRIVGPVAVSPVSISDGTSATSDTSDTSDASSASRWVRLGPTSVAPECQRQGIGSLLIQAALRRLREARISWRYRWRRARGRRGHLLARRRLAAS